MGNKENPGGHPPIHETPESLQSAIDQYFKKCKKDKDFPNVAGMTVFLGYAATQSLFDQEKRGADFSSIIKKAKLRMWDGKYQFACKGEMDKTIFIFDSINNHAMVNTRSENKNSQSGEDGGPIKHSLTVTFVGSKK